MKKIVLLLACFLLLGQAPFTEKTSVEVRLKRLEDEVELRRQHIKTKRITLPSQGRLNFDGSSNNYVFYVHESDEDRLKFYINDSISFWIGATRCYMPQGVAIGTNNGSYHLDDATDGASSATLYIGNETIDTTPPSDENVKKNIRDSDKGLAEILQLHVKEYNYKQNYVDDKNKTHTGLIAQEVESVYPYALIDRTDGFKSVNLKKFIPLLIKSIQELEARIKTLEQ